jgi:hypothetical protein
LIEAFYAGFPSNNPYSLLAADTGLITLACNLLPQLPVQVLIKHQWVKGHYKGEKELPHELNHLAEKLATDFNSVDRGPSRSPPILSPLYEAELIKDNYIITSRLTTILISALYDDHLQMHLCKRMDWSQGVFDKVDWEAY